MSNHKWTWQITVSEKVSTKLPTENHDFWHPCLTSLKELKIYIFFKFITQQMAPMQLVREKKKKVKNKGHPEGHPNIEVKLLNSYCIYKLFFKDVISRFRTNKKDSNFF